MKILKPFVIFFTIFNSINSSALAIGVTIDHQENSGIRVGYSGAFITGPDGDISFVDSTESPGIYGSGHGIGIEVNTSSDKGVRMVGNSAILIENGLLNLHIKSGIVTSQLDDPSKGALVLQDSFEGMNFVTLDAGTTLSNTASSNGNAIYYKNDTGLQTGLTINNGGSITVVDEANSNAIILEDSLDNSSLLVTNNRGGLIGSQLAPSNSVSAITVTGLNSANITNFGTINGNIALGYNSSSTITSSGNINGNIVFATGQSLNLNDSSVTRGNINGLSAGRGVVNTGSGTETIYADIGVGNSINSFNIGSGSRTKLFGDVSASAINLDGQLELLNSAGNSLVGNVTGDGSSGGAGNLNLSSYSHNLAGNITLGSSDILSTTIVNPTLSGNLTVNGLASTDVNTALHVSLSGGTTSVGSSYRILSGLSGSSLNKISDNNISVDGGNNHSGSFIFTTSISEARDSLILTVSRFYVPQIADNGNQLGLYNSIVRISSATGSLLTLQRYLDSDINNPGGYSVLSSLSVQDGSLSKSSVLNSALAQVDNSSNRLAFDNINNSANLISRHLSSIRQNKDKKCDKALIKNQACKESGWGEVFGSSSTQGDTAVSNGYNAQTSGLIIGYDKKIDKELLLGASFTYSNSKVKGSDNLKRTNINNHQLNIYSSHNFEKFFINNMVGFGFNTYSSYRSIPVSSVNANGKYNGKTYMARSEIGVDHKLKNDFILTPTFAITAARNSINQYSENNAGTLNLNVKNNAAGFLEARVGMLLSKNYKLLDKVVMPSVSISYGYDFLGAKQKTSANFIGQSSNFNSSGAEIEQGSLRMGAGLKLYQLNYLTLSADYGFEHRVKYDSHAGSFRVKYNF